MRTHPRSGAANGELFDDVPKRSCVVPHSDIPRHDRHHLWRFAEQLCRRKMYRVERADRLDRKRAAHTSKHRSVDVDNEAAPLEGTQGTNSRLFIGWRQPSRCARPDDRSACLCEGKRRRHMLCAGRRLQDRWVVLQQCGNQRTRLHVPNVRCGCARPTGTRDGLLDRTPATNAMLRHDRCRSVQRRFPAAA